MKKLLSILSSIMIILPCALSQEDGLLNLTGSYFGQETPGNKPEVFAKDLSSGDYKNGGFVFSKSGNEVFFFAINQTGQYELHYSKITNGYWQEPQDLELLDSGNSLHPFFSVDGQEIFFGSNSRIEADKKVPYSNIWVSERNAGSWSKAKPLPPVINSGFENCGSFSNEYKLFFRRVSPQTRGDIFSSMYLNGEFTEPVKLPREINTGYDESHPAISPDGSYLIFSSKRPGGYSNGRDDLWVSFSKADGEWSRALNLGKEINNGSNTSCATISPDGKYLFFLRIENGITRSYWVSTKIIEDLN